MASKRRFGLLVAGSIALVACGSDDDLKDTRPADGDVSDVIGVDVDTDTGSDTEIDSTMGDTDVTDSGATDGTSSDTGSKDSGAADSAAADTGASDSGTSDTGGSDTSVSGDSGTTDTGVTDTGALDTGPFDTGPFDTGTTADSATGDTGSFDTGPSDTGTTFDTGPFDTGTTFDTGSFDTAFDTASSDTGGSLDSATGDGGPAVDGDMADIFSDATMTKFSYSHSITLDGVNDFNAGETFTTTSTGYTAYVSWDASYVYVGYQGPDIGSSASDTKWVFVYLDGVSGGSNKTALFSNQQHLFATGFDGDVYFAWKTNGSYQEIKRWNGSSWSTITSAVVVSKSGDYVEMAIPIAAIGTTSKLGVTTFMLNEASGGEWTYAGLYGDSFADGYSSSGTPKTIAHWVDAYATTFATPNDASRKKP